MARYMLVTQLVVMACDHPSSSSAVCTAHTKSIICGLKFSDKYHFFVGANIFVDLKLLNLFFCLQHQQRKIIIPKEHPRRQANQTRPMPNQSRYPSQSRRQLRLPSQQRKHPQKPRKPHPKSVEQRRPSRRQAENEKISTDELVLIKLSLFVFKKQFHKFQSNFF